MRTKAPEANSWLLAHKRAAALSLIGAIALLILCLDILAAVIVKFI